MKSTTIIALLFFVNANIFAQSFLAKNPIELDWQLEYKLPERSRPQTTKANVPGAVQLDIAKAENYGDYYFEENWQDYLWMEDQFFTYRSEFPRPIIPAGGRLFFISKGIDYEFEITLNGSKLLKQEGMFTPVKLDITDYLLTLNNIEIRIFPVPKIHNKPADHSQVAQSVKPAVSYGWDFHPRLIPSGIWDDTFLEINPPSYIKDTRLTYRLNDNLTAAEIDLTVTGTDLAGCNVIWKLRDQNDDVILAQVINPDTDEIEINANLSKVILWWPHDHGDQYLYTYEIELRNSFNELLQVVTNKFGFRKVRLLENEEKWQKSNEFSKSVITAPIQIEINGRQIFVKGASWVNPEIFPGIITPELYNNLTDLAIGANFNLLRVWGGGIINKDAFYEQCDRKGLMVWQDFPLAENNYNSTPEYLALLEQEAESIIKKLRNHPSIVIWSGGSELFNPENGMTSQSRALRLLNSLCLKQNPETPFISTYPLNGMAQGPFSFKDKNTGKEVYAQMELAHYTAYSAFGISSPASLGVLRKILPKKELWPPQAGTSWESHHAYNAWGDSAWLMQYMIEDYFGPSESLEELVQNGQIIQSEGYKAIYEEARRQKPSCSMALSRNFNEPWPTAAGTSIISWPDIPKPAFYAVREACRPVLASARIKKFKWQEGELFESDIYILNDSAKPVESGRIVVKFVAGGRELTVMNWDHDLVEANRNLQGPTIRKILPAWDVDRFKLQLEVIGHPEYNSEYLLLFEKELIR